MSNQPTPESASPPAVWSGGDPLMEAIAAAVWERCEHSDSGLIIDDPRTIAAAAAHAVRALQGDRGAAIDRTALSEKLWQIAEHHIIAEWICCEPLEPRHQLCAKGYAALGMTKTLLVDSDPKKAWNPAAPVLDAVIAELEQLRRVADEQPTTTKTETGTLASMFEGLGRLLATSSRDWGLYAPDAWLYAVVLGWDCEQAEHDETCTHGAMEEMQQRHGWSDEAVAKARRYRAAVRALTRPAGAGQDGAQPS